MILKCKEYKKENISDVNPTIIVNNIPLNLIQIVQPYILVKGSNYEGKDVVYIPITKELKLVQFVDAKSTTKTIEKIQACNS